MAIGPSDEEPGIKEKSNVLLVTELMQAWNARDTERALALYAPGYEGSDVAQANPQQGPEGAGETMARYLNAFPDLHLISEAVIEQGDQVALFWTAQGTHQGPIMNIPATGRRIQVRGASLFTVVKGQVIRGLNVWDVAGLLRSIGLLPEL